MSEISFRPATKEDLPLIYNSWLRSYRKSRFARDIDDKIYYQFHHQIIENILKRSTVVIAHPQGKQTTISGFLVFESKDNTPVIHYCYTKFAYRNLGVASSLLAHANLDPNKELFFTHEQSAPMWLSKKFPSLRYCPYAI